MARMLMSRPSMLPLIGLCAVLTTVLPEIESKAVLTNNGYQDFVVAISPDVPQDDSIIESIKSMMRDMSRELYISTRNRAYVRAVKILLPITWKYPTDAPVTGESYEDAEFRIDRPNSIYGNSPYTQQTTNCGEPGDFTHLTPDFVKDGTKFGNKGKTLVHEFAKLRWGVFEEHGYPGDSKFPMFYLDTYWSADGQRTVARPNFCVNGEIRGYQQDLQTGGACKSDPLGSGLPDGNCMYYATQDSQVNSSIMSLPYLSTNVQFCDDESEKYLHNPDLLNKQNLYCDGQSTWSVIMKSPDFVSNSPVQVDNTDPTFTVLGGEQEVLKYVMVMDVSRSMSPEYNDNKVDRLTPMKDAAKRWIRYDVPDRTLVGMLPFSTKTYLNENGFSMTTVNDASKQSMIDKIDGLSIKSGTCITDGLLEAAANPGLLNNEDGNVIILLTDGKQEGSCRTNYNTAKNTLVQKRIRLVTIAIGPDADSQIEDMAEATNGKTYFVEDNSGPGDFSDAFTGSTTYQPSGTINTQVMTVYKKDFKYENPIRDVFEIDTTIGRDLTFRLEVKKGSMVCNSPIVVSLIDPDNGRTDENFVCGKDNLGTFMHKFSDLAKPGKWTFLLKSTEAFDSISVVVTSRSREDSDDPIRTQCWIKTGEQGLGEDIMVKLAAVAEVKKGNMPIIGATVKAYITRPGDSGDSPPLELDLKDNGAGADGVKNDGLYSRYFTKYTGKGRYSVKCQVAGDSQTQINQGFIISRKGHPKAIPSEPGAPVCCGSDAVTPNSVLTDTGNFTRQSAGGSFQSDKPASGSDIIPPAKVTDLKMVGDCVSSTLEFTSPGDDLDSDEPVNRYIIKFSKYSANLTEDSFDDTAVVELTSDYLRNGSVLDPQAGGTLVSLQLDSTKFQRGVMYYFAMRSTDEAYNLSPVSNIVYNLCGTPQYQPNRAPDFRQSLLFTIFFSALTLALR